MVNHNICFKLLLIFVTFLEGSVAKNLKYL